MLAPLVEAVPVAGVVADAGFSAVLLFEFVLPLFVVSVVVQAINSRPQTRDSANVVVLRINCSFIRIKPEGLKSWEIILADGEIW